MKLLLSLIASLCFSVASAATMAEMAAPVDNMSLKGEVLEIKDVESYTYMRLKTKDGEIWAAVMTAQVKKGEQVTIENAMTMDHFESRALKKTFDKIVFGKLAGASAKAGTPAAPATASKIKTGPAMSAPAASQPDAKVAKASGADAHTVAEVVGKRMTFKDKNVVIRGKVVKFTEGVMDKNWIHLRDGSGSAKDNSNDILVTTTDMAKIGDIVTAKGIVHVDKDFGAGYSFQVLVEDGKLQK